ncbi:MAG: hypothetical protein ACE5GE_06165 [Phycisphaerae bacterium]
MGLGLLAVCGGFSDVAQAAPAIVAGDVVVLELIAGDPVALRDVDMLAFDAFGNLMANRETFGGTGGVSYVDIDAGTATILVSGISRADGLTLHPSGALYVASEISGVLPFNRIYRIDVTYDAGNVPLSATATSITTSIGINNPEGIVALTADSAFGSAGDLYVCEDRTPGRIFHLVLTAGNNATASILVNSPANLRRPEGLTLGDFSGQLAGPMLFAAETTDNNVLQIDATGAFSVLGNPAAVAMNQPDNVKFGHDGMLYVSEDIGAGNGRIIRIAVDGTHEVVLSGFNFPQGMAFDFARSDLYVAEQGSARVWRARFDTATDDADGDGDVDLFDAGSFQRCFGAVPMTLECLVFDSDRNDTIDLTDHQLFEAMLVGP